MHMQYKTPQFPYWNLKVWNILKNQNSQKLNKQNHCFINSSYAHITVTANFLLVLGQ